MKSIKYYSFGLCVLAIIAPFVCNFFIGIPHLPNTYVVGEATDWLVFYGSYIGSTISTLGAFIILYITIKNSTHRQELELRHKEILVIREDLANRFGKYCVSELVRLNSFDHPTQEKLVNEATYLQIMRDKYRGLAYSATFLYANGHNYEELFFEKYEDLVNETVKLIDELMKFYSLGTWNEERQSKMLLYAQRIDFLSSKNDEVHEIAYKFYSSLVDEFQYQQKYKL